MFALTLNFIKNIPNVDFMVILVKFATCHVRNTFKRPLRPNAPTVRVLTSVILKGIGWTFRKLYPSKIPGMVHQGLLAPEGLCETKGADQLRSNCKADQRLSFRYTDSTIPLLLINRISRLILAFFFGVYRPVCTSPGRNCWFSRDMAQMSSKFSTRSERTS